MSGRPCASSMPALRELRRGAAGCAPRGCGPTRPSSDAPDRSTSRQRGERRMRLAVEEVGHRRGSSARKTSSVPSRAVARLEELDATRIRTSSGHARRRGRRWCRKCDGAGHARPAPATMRSQRRGRALAAAQSRRRRARRATHAPTTHPPRQPRHVRRRRSAATRSAPSQRVCTGSARRAGLPARSAEARTTLASFIDEALARKQGERGQGASAMVTPLPGRRGALAGKRESKRPRGALRREHPCGQARQARLHRRATRRQRAPSRATGSAPPRTGRTPWCTSPASRAAAFHAMSLRRVAALELPQPGEIRRRSTPGPADGVAAIRDDAAAAGTESRGAGNTSAARGSCT